MSKLGFVLTLFLLIQSANLCAQSALDGKIEAARNSLVKLIQEEQIHGLSITVSYQDSVIWSEGFGYSDLSKMTPIEPDKTLFRIASISKPITATILGRLYEEKQLDFEESVYTYVPQFPPKEFDFSLLQLATHRSGIRHYRVFERENTKPLSIEEGLEKFQKSKLKFEPGTRYLYSSYGYNLLGLALEKASDKSFEDLLKLYVTEPLGMMHTIPDKNEYEAIQTSGFFKSVGKGKIKEAKSVSLALKVPSGGMLSTSEDLVTFGNAYAYQRLLQPETQARMLSDEPLPNGKKTGYGIGWGLKVDAKGREIWSHTGGNTGSVCRLIIYPESKLTVAVVSNTYGIDWLNFIRTVNGIPLTILSE